ncbi:hypothetical protein DACRYDRAFT_109637 [Dacryopinax primogenitus]|uniref:Uncharacterized protein n=1 Tax=Dacryopinax primogenitus (strain DJM 731) TaxID=1858805 RepID=M5FR46_DACPD|nr:uncharacterized protein DACRYDRAFT_109637 [Dacryopinax primogenitus]EJT99535.1 hypothetical protein DACRYDRAFT_109637 [Dacryopinax primogenitus]
MDLDDNIQPVNLDLLPPSLHTGLLSSGGSTWNLQSGTPHYCLPLPSPSMALIPSGRSLVLTGGTSGFHSGQHVSGFQSAASLPHANINMPIALLINFHMLMHKVAAGVQLPTTKIGRPQPMTQPWMDHKVWKDERARVAMVSRMIDGSTFNGNDLHITWYKELQPQIFDILTTSDYILGALLNMCMFARSRSDPPDLPPFNPYDYFPTHMIELLTPPAPAPTQHAPSSTPAGKGKGRGGDNSLAHLSLASRLLANHARTLYSRPDNITELPVLPRLLSKLLRTYQDALQIAPLYMSRIETKAAAIYHWDMPRTWLKRMDHVIWDSFREELMSDKACQNYSPHLHALLADVVNLMKSEHLNDYYKGRA